MTTQTLTHESAATLVARIVETNGGARFSELLAERRTATDEEIASLIYADGRARMAIGRTAELSNYACVLPRGVERSLTLDAAIDVCTQSLMAQGMTLDDAVEELTRARPDLRDSIVRGALLHEIISSSLPTGMATSLLDDRDLPAPFGPEMPDGRLRYTLLKSLGRGSFSVVYYARDEALSGDDDAHEAPVAIKVLSQSVAPNARHRFNREAQLARRVNHENVVRVLDRGEFRDDLYIVYEHIDGESLRRWAGSDADRHRVREMVRVVAQAAAGLSAVHEVGLLHRDIKPGNILVRADGVVKVCDLGLADAPGVQPTDALTGNVVLMSPERLIHGDQESSVRSDVYSLGGVLYWLLTGEYPLGWQKLEIRRAAMQGRGPVSPRSINPNVDRDLEAICIKALAHNPSDRYASMEAFGADLRAWLERRPVAARRRSSAGRFRLWALRQPIAAAFLLLFVLSLAGGAGATVYLLELADERLAEAENQRQINKQVADGLRTISRSIDRSVQEGRITETEAKLQRKALVDDIVAKYAIDGPQSRPKD